MFFFSLICLLIVAAACGYLPVSIRRQADIACLFALLSSVMAVYIAWPGFSQSRVFGPASVWYLDGLSALIMVLIAIISLSTMLVSRRYLALRYADRIISLTDIRHYYSTAWLFIATMYVAVLANNLGVLWLALEISTLTIALLTAFYRKRSAVEAAWRYLMLCTLGVGLGFAGFMLTAYAAGQVGLDGSLLLSTFRDLAKAGNVNSELIKWAFIFTFVGLGTKIGLVPMHAWLPDTHSKAPSPVAGLLSALLLNVTLIALLRIRQVTDLTLLDQGDWTGKFFLVFGCLSIIVPALIMLMQKNYKRLLAYSSIEHMGLTAFSIGLGPAGLIPALMHLPGHALLKSSLFFGAGEISAVYKSTDAAAVSGLWTRLPQTARLALLTVLCLLAAPPSALFVSQLLTFGLGLQEHWLMTLVVVLAVTVAYVATLRFIYGLLFMTQTDDITQSARHEPWNLTHTVVFVHALLVLALGVFYLTPMGLEFILGISQSLTTGTL